MRIVIIGVGTIGRAILETLSGEGHAVVDYSIGVCYRLRMK